MPPIRKRRRKQEAAPAFLRFWWVGLILMALLVGGAAFLLRPQQTSARRLVGYIPSSTDLRVEYARSYSRPLDNPEVLAAMGAVECPGREARLRRRGGNPGNHRENRGGAGGIQ